MFLVSRFKANLSKISKVPLYSSSKHETSQLKDQVSNVKSNQIRASQFPSQLMDDIDGDKISYKSRLDSNMLGRLHVRKNSPGMTPAGIADKFNSRVLLLGKVYLFIKPQFQWAKEVEREDDNELYYDVEKMDLKLYLKEMLFTPKHVGEQDFFLKALIIFYFAFFANWFIIDILIFKIIYSENEILEIDDSKKYIVSQLKGEKFKVQLNESELIDPFEVQRQQDKLLSILNLDPSLQKKAEPVNNINPTNPSI